MSTKQEEWPGGKAAVAVLHARLGRTTKARQILQQLLRQHGQEIPPAVLLTLASQIKEISELEDLAIKMYEGGVEEAVTENAIPFNEGPVDELLSIYHQADRQDALHLLIDRLIAAARDSNQTLSQAISFQNVGVYPANKLNTLGYPLDVLRVSKLTLADNTEGPSAIMIVTGDPAIHASST